MLVPSGLETLPIQSFRAFELREYFLETEGPNFQRVRSRLYPRWFAFRMSAKGNRRYFDKTLTAVGLKTDFGLEKLPQERGCVSSPHSRITEEGGES